MPLLNWKIPAAELNAQTEPSSRMEQTNVKLRLTRLQAEELASAILALAPGQELRHSVTQNWTVFWKLREGESRLLLAHPETDQWVATFALTSPDRDLIAQKLAEGLEFKLSQSLALGWQSNLDWTWAV